jgi:hypothetical protein
LPVFLVVAFHLSGCDAKRTVKVFSVESVDPGSFTLSNFVKGQRPVLLFKIT